MTDLQTREAIREATDNWWLFALAGTGWFIVSLVILRLNLASVATVGILLGAVFLISALEEIFVASIGGAWAFFRAIAAVLFFAGALWCFFTPLGAFWSLAVILGFLLIFKGTLDLVTSIAAQDVNPAWWLGLIAGILEIGLGFWASTQYLPERALLLLLWAGFYTLFRGFSDIALAFSVKATR